ncbi:MAG: phosphoribosylamine--glycine ligase [Candidatus Dadabacteria bacterium]|nr:MAG: phosphoribosylamine--glycine ligase [Candidatus Dadabacteria bacterium]
MRVLVVGSGGREHALCWKIKQSPLVKTLYCAPGNPGISRHAECVDIKISDIEGLLRFARAEEIDITVVGPEFPLSLGIADRFTEEGLGVFGPSKAASEIETSKVFSKNLMRKYGIPTAFFSSFDDFEQAVDWVKEVKPPLVIKADGLASGKGVFICRTESEAVEVLDDIMRRKIFGDSGDRVVIEEFLSGEEASFFAVTDGTNVLPLESCQDHKALLDGDQGPNTGGMGAYSPAPVITPGMSREIMSSIIIPTVKALKDEGREYKGVLYAGLMIEDGKARVLEYNCRFGDPETQPLMMRMKSDIVPVLSAVAGRGLSGEKVEWRDEASVCVVMASRGYPGDYKKGAHITGLDALEDMENVMVFHAGTAVGNGGIVTDGGRVLGVTALGRTIPDAINLAYQAVGKVNCDSLCFRSDIGKKALRHILLTGGASGGPAREEANSG